MAISMYTVSIPAFVQHLTALSAILDKAAAHAAARKFDPALFLTMRLYPDMYDLSRQVEQACKQAARGASLLAGTNIPELPAALASLPDLKELIAKTIDFLKSLKPEQIDGTEEKEIKVAFSSGERTFTGQSLLLNFTLPNFWFHTTTAYDILRHCGVELVKRDFLGTPVKP
jgi:hypothetical protein